MRRVRLHLDPAVFAAVHPALAEASVPAFVVAVRVAFGYRVGLLLCDPSVLDRLVESGLELLVPCLVDGVGDGLLVDFEDLGHEGADVAPAMVEASLAEPQTGAGEALGALVVPSLELVGLLLGDPFLFDELVEPGLQCLVELAAALPA